VPEGGGVGGRGEAGFATLSVPPPPNLFRKKLEI